MKLKKGTKVEVSRKAEMPFGCWRCAEIIGGNGHYYSIRYDDGSHGEAVAARVPREAIRPCPPVLELTQDWQPGDVVEVRQKFSWSTAVVLKVSGENNVLVRLLVSSLDFMVNKIDIRVRQSWQNEEWIGLGKGSSSGKNGKCCKKLAPRLSSMLSAQAQKTSTTTQHSSNHDYLNDKKEVMHYQNSHLGSSKTLKRKSHPHVGLSAEPPQKLRVSDNEHTGGSLNNREKSDESVSSSAGSCSVTGFGVHIGDLEVTTSDAESLRHCRYDNEHTGGSLNDRKSDDSVSSSVGSCSVTGFGVHIGDLEVATSDAKSARQCRYEKRNCSVSSKEGKEAEIHRSELHAYRYIIETFCASGPWSREQGAFIAKVRRSLHISNDEHLAEIKNLISSEN